MVLVVEPDADEFPGIRDRRMQACRTAIDGHPFRDAGDRVLRSDPAFEELAGARGDEGSRDVVGAHDAAARQRGRKAGLQIGDSVALEGA